MRIEVFQHRKSGNVIGPDEGGGKRRIPVLVGTAKRLVILMGFLQTAGLGQSDAA